MLNRLSKSKRARVWQWFGALLLVVACFPWALGCGSCGPDPTPPPGSQCTAVVGGTTVRTLEVIDGSRHFFDAGPRAWPPLRNGDSIGVVQGFQGSDMVTPELQIFDEESTAAEGTERCMRVTYVGATQDFERDLIFVRRGSRWVYPTPVSDPIQNSGPVTLNITIQDAELTASTVLMLDAR